jgi:hypothetical protein
VSPTSTVGTSLSESIVSASSPIRELLSYSDPIGTVFRLVDFDEALVITNDSFVHAAMGVPRHAFLLATPAELADPQDAGLPDADDEEVILLRVTGNVALPQEEDIQFLRAEAGLELIIDQARDRPVGRDELIDALTAERMQTSGLRCAVLGTFYDQDQAAGRRLAFGSDLDTVYASTRLRVFKPWGDSLQRIVSFMADHSSDEERRPFRIGRVRYASTRRRESLAREAGRPIDVPVDIDVADLVAHKTAVLGMTRKGKSNTMKVIAAAVHEYAQAKGIPIGQLIFDPAGEYANVNVQDRTALAEIGREHVTRFRLGATDVELAAEPDLRPLALNFFDEELIAVTWSIVGQFVQSQRDADYVKSFAAADVQGPANPQARDEWKQVAYARRARAMAFACLLKAGLQPPAGWSMWVPLKESVRQALIDAGGTRGQDLSFLSAVQTSRRGDQVRLSASQLLAVCEGLAANFHGDRHSDIEDWVHVPDNRVEHIVDVLMQRRGSGYKILLPLRDGYHAPSAVADYAPSIHSDLVNGKIVIVDLSRGGEGVLQYASERIISYVLDRAAERFRTGQEAHRIQIFLEEAHRLFDRDRFQRELAEADPYVRLAREAGKYKLGMIYATQQVSSVEQDVLDNTANWVIAHLNSENEIKRLAGRYEFARFAEQIRRAEDIGFVRLKTLSSRFVIPVQVRRFDRSVVEAARGVDVAAEDA